ncbi:MAG: hypothetical protein WCC17_04140 [Candidatus Nitrosopolaris sp.]|jgi:hypothetical protein
MLKTSKVHLITKMNYKVRVLKDSIKFYLPRTEGYLEIIRYIAQQYGAMSLIEFDGYFEGKFEPTKYMLVGVHADDIKEDNLMGFANKIRIMLKQKSLAFEYNNRLILVEESTIC